MAQLDSAAAGPWYAYQWPKHEKLHLRISLPPLQNARSSTGMDSPAAADDINQRIRLRTEPNGCSETSQVKVFISMFQNLDSWGQRPARQRNGPCVVQSVTDMNRLLFGYPQGSFLLLRKSARRETRTVLLSMKLGEKNTVICCFHNKAYSSHWSWIKKKFSCVVLGGY